MTALQMAIELKNLEIVDLILTYANNLLVDLVSQTHGSALHVACAKGDLKVVQKLVFRGSDIFLRHPRTGKTPKETADN